jgi:peptidoglycan/LPS O-acetylase OafA/YrhL
MPGAGAIHPICFPPIADVTLSHVLGQNRKERNTSMTELFVPLFMVGAFLGPWILEGLRAPKAFALCYALIIVALACLWFLGMIHLQVPKVWGAPLAIILVLGGMIGAARLLVRSLKSHRSVPR